MDIAPDGIYLSRLDFDRAFVSWKEKRRIKEPRTAGIFLDSALSPSGILELRHQLCIPKDEEIYLLHDKELTGRTTMFTVLTSQGIYSMEEYEMFFFLGGKKTNFVSWGTLISAGLLSRYEHWIYLDGIYIANGFMNSKNLFLILVEVRNELWNVYPEQLYSTVSYPAASILLNGSDFETLHGRMKAVFGLNTSRAAILTNPRNINGKDPRERSLGEKLLDKLLAERRGEMGDCINTEQLSSKVRSFLATVSSSTEAYFFFHKKGAFTVIAGNGIHLIEKEGLAAEFIPWGSFVSMKALLFSKGYLILNGERRCKGTVELFFLLSVIYNYFRGRYSLPPPPSYQFACSLPQSTPVQSLPTPFSLSSTGSITLSLETPRSSVSTEPNKEKTMSWHHHDRKSARELRTSLPTVESLQTMGLERTGSSGPHHGFPTSLFLSSGPTSASTTTPPMLSFQHLSLIADEQPLWLTTPPPYTH